MTNTKILERITKIYDESCDIKTREMLAGFLKEVRSEIETQANKKAGKGAQSKVIKKLLKKNIKDKRPEKFRTSYVFGGEQYVATLYQIFCFTDPSTDVPIETEDNYGMESMLSGQIREIPAEELKVPDYGKLKVFYMSKKNERKKNKSDAPVSYWFGKIMVNAEYLLYILEAMPNVKLYWDGHCCHPIYGIDDKGSKCMLCPLQPISWSHRKTKEENEKCLDEEAKEFLKEQARYGL